MFKKAYLSIENTQWLKRWLKRVDARATVRGFISMPKMDSTSMARDFAISKLEMVHNHAILETNLTTKVSVLCIYSYLVCFPKKVMECGMLDAVV